MRKGKTYILFIFILTLCVIIYGCGYSIPINKQDEKDIKLIQTNKNLDTQAISIRQYDKNSTGYYYKQLTDPEKKIYELIVACIESYSKEAKIQNATDDEISKAYQSVTFDYPDFFWCEGYQTIKYQDTKEKSITFLPAYTKNETEINKGIQDIIAYEKNFSKASDDYTTAKNVFDIIVEDTNYNIQSDNIDNVLSVINGKNAVCEGYAKTFQMVMNYLGYDCIVVPGYIKSSGTMHMWNAVNLDGEWYYVDPTWGDAGFNDADSAPEIRYDYFCVTDNMISDTHTISTFVNIPKCSSLKDNYYNKMGLIVDSTKSKVVSEVLNKLSLEKSVTFMCSSDQTYKEVYHYLIDAKKIHNYTDKTREIGFYSNVKTHIFTFWYVK